MTKQLHYDVPTPVLISIQFDCNIQSLSSVFCSFQVALPKLLLFCLHHLLLRSNKNTSNSFYWTKNVHRIVTSRYSTVDCWFNSAAAIQIVFVTWSHHPLIVMPEIQDEHIYADLCNAHTVDVCFLLLLWFNRCYFCVVRPLFDSTLWLCTYRTCCITWGKYVKPCHR